MQLDVIVATHNRSELLARLLESLLRAPVPAGLAVRVMVVDNNSSDETPRVVERWAPAFEGRLRYLFEGQPGKSAALNAAIAAGDGDLIGIVDDDEEIDRGWYAAAHAAFAGGEVDFVGGPYLPRWGADPPRWLPKKYPAAIGWVEGPPEPTPFHENSAMMPMAGNVVLRRAIVERVGPFRTDLGRIGTARLGSAEDEEYFQRLLAAGARGTFLPHLIIYHYIPPERLTKRYHRRWCLWRGVSLGIIDRTRRQPVDYLAGVPRYLLGEAARAALSLLTLRALDRPDERFAAELALWDLAGFVYGKHFSRASVAPPAR